MAKHNAAKQIRHLPVIATHDENPAQLNLMKCS